MAAPNDPKTKKEIYKSIEELSGLDPDYFKQGVVDILKLLYEQDVTMTNEVTKRIVKLESKQAMLRGLMLGLHLNVLQQDQPQTINDEYLRETATLYDIDYLTIKAALSSDTLRNALNTILKHTHPK